MTTGRINQVTTVRPHACALHTHIETQPHTRYFEWRRSHTASLLQVDYDPKAPVGPCVKTAAQQAVAPSALIAIYTATQNTQAICSVRLFCHRPRHELQPTPIHHTPRNRTQTVHSDQLGHTPRVAAYKSVAGSPASRLRQTYGGQLRCTQSN